MLRANWGGLTTSISVRKTKRTGIGLSGQSGRPLARAQCVAKGLGR